MLYTRSNSRIEKLVVSLTFDAFLTPCCRGHPWHLPTTPTSYHSTHAGNLTKVPAKAVYARVFAVHTNNIFFVPPPTGFLSYVIFDQVSSYLNQILHFQLSQAFNQN